MKKHLTASHQTAHPHDKPLLVEIISLTERELLARIEQGDPELWQTVWSTTRPSSKSHKRTTELWTTHLLTIIEFATDYDHLKELFPNGAPINPNAAFFAYCQKHNRFRVEKFKQLELVDRIKFFIDAGIEPRKMYLNTFATTQERVTFLGEVLAHIKVHRLRHVRHDRWIQKTFTDLSVECVLSTRPEPQ